MVDRRVARSRRALRNALAALLRDRDYDEITVGDLLVAADVGRSTFYSHYTGKDDLLRQSFQMLHGEVREAVQARRAAPGPTADLAFSAILLKHIHEHRRLNRRLRGRGAEILLQEINHLVGGMIKEGLEGVASPEAIRPELTVQFLRGGFISLLMDWLDGPAGRSPAEIDAAFQALARRGLQEPSAAAPGVGAEMPV